MNFNPKKHKEDLLFLPLGGANEIGMNLNLYHLNGKWLMIDCGIGFANDVPGIDMMTPDISFIKQNRHNLLGIVLTHIHEDHLGSVQYLWEELEVPIYASNLAANFLRSKLEEFNLHKKVPIHVIDNKKELELKPFKLEFIGLTHSVPEMKAIIIKTKKGNILHTGDWKFDPDPVVGDVSDKEIIKSYGQNNEIDVMVCDSTNVLSPGHSKSEGELYEQLKKLIENQKGYVGVATFASNLARIETIAKIAHEVGRKIVLSGYSLKRLYDVAKKSGYFLQNYGFISEVEAKYYSKNELLIICTGCQGEPMASARKIATNRHKYIKFGRDDLMIFSSKIIPGNEKKIFELFGLLAKKEINVITEKDHFVHVSGHPYQEELKEMYELAKPKLAIPVHGEFIHTKAHCDLARKSGVKKAIQIENGKIVKIDNKDIASSVIISSVKSGYFGVDGKQLIDLDGKIIQERRKLQSTGIINISIVLNSNLEILSDIRISAIGSYDIYNDPEAQDFIEDEIRNYINSKAKRIRSQKGFGIRFFKKKKKNRGKNTKEKLSIKIANELEKDLRGKLIKVFNDLMGKKPAIEVVIHLV